MHNDSKVAIDHILRTLDEDDNGKGECRIDVAYVLTSAKMILFLRLDDWRACGSNIIVHVQTCLDSLDHVRTFAPQDKNHRILQGVLQQARHHIENQHHSKVQRQWRRLYTDTAILQGIATLMTEEGFGELDAERAQTISGSIRDLDIAIVQCGAPGYERLDMLHQVIQLLQERISAKERTIEVRPAPSNVVSDLEKCDDYCLAKQTVRQMDTIPSLRQYQQELHKTPLVVRGYALDWPALKDDHRHWSDINYLLRVAGPSRVVPVEIGRLYLDKDWSQAIILWTEFLESSGWDKSKGSQADQVIYLAQHNLFKQFPQLEEDIVVPDIVYACPPSPSSFIQYSPPLDEDGTEICVKNAWIGPKGTTSPPHYDPYYNAYGESPHRSWSVLAQLFDKISTSSSGRS